MTLAQNWPKNSSISSPRDTAPESKCKLGNRYSGNNYLDANDANRAKKTIKALSP